MSPAELETIGPTIARLREVTARLILFVDPDCPDSVLDKIRPLGADGIEIYTGSYAAAFRNGQHDELLNACADTASRARARGLVVDAGHDLNLKNIPPFIQRIPFLGKRLSVTN